jgi:hypothetical protein
MSGLLHALAALLRDKEPRNLLCWRLGGPQSRSRCCGEKSLPFQFIIYFHPITRGCIVMAGFTVVGAPGKSKSDPVSSPRGTHEYIRIYRMSQEERSYFWEVTASAILSKKVYIYVSYSKWFLRYSCFTVW